MLNHKRLFKTSKNLYQKLLRNIKKNNKKLFRRLLNSLLKLGQGRGKLSKAGFILPTVMMITLVVTLMTVSIMVRSFDRAKNAANYRINQVVLDAATPALYRAREKIKTLFSDPNLPRGTPTEIAINNVLNKDKYTLGDEVKLELTYDFGNGQGNFSANGTIESLEDATARSLQDEEKINSAWRFPIDTDNNSKFDSFTLYTILFRSPNTNADGTFARERNPLEARALPMEDGQLTGICTAATGTSSSLVGTEGWYQSDGQLKKSLFVYVATVPITDKSLSSLIDSFEQDKFEASDFETYNGSSGFSALEYQQDQAIIPLNNNAVVYEDDINVFPAGIFRLNGRVFTNSNLLIREDNDIELYQVSSRNSCFYNSENAKIVVGGNVGYGTATDITNPDSKEIRVDLFQGSKDNQDPDISKTISATNKSVNHVSADIAYNNQAYEQRIAKLVDLAKTAAGTLIVTGSSPNIEVSNSYYPSIVLEGIANQLNSTNPPTTENALNQELETYFRNRTRRVPYAEVPFNPSQTPQQNDPELVNASLQGQGDELRPSNNWIFPFAPDDGKTESGFAELALKQNGTDKIYPQATELTAQEKSSQETRVGDRILLGNNLPSLWYNQGDFVSSVIEQKINGIKWDSGEAPRSRKTRVETLSDLGGIERDNFWETKASQQPENPLDGVGGLRIVTNAGIYLPFDTATSNNVVWPDYLPQPSDNPNHPNYDRVIDEVGNKLDSQSDRPYLRMRASAVYHYRYQNGEKPIACVSSFYDPTNSITTRNPDTLEDVSGEIIGVQPTTLEGANSNNGITYSPFSFPSANSELQYQANLVYPNGRLVNPLLQQALAKTASERTLAEQAAIDATSCSLQILDGTLSANTNPTSGYTLSHGTIKEVTLLDGRQIQNIDENFSPYDSANGATTGNNSLNGKYNYPIEQRQPLEIRTTVIDLEQLRQQQADGNSTPPEYLLPNSGIIYATRDDALPDASDVQPVEANNSNVKIAATDFKLDPTRRPHGIMLINGRRLWRTNTFREEEKGLILASNLPLYIKGEFNLHADSQGNPQEEFLTTLADDYSNFYTRNNLNNNFACRQGDPRLPTGACQNPDEWRPATVLSDAITLLSDNFREGFRNEGDYDLRNNQIAQISDPNNTSSDNSDDIETASDIANRRLENGFWSNNFVTNGLSSSGINVNGITPQDSDYVDSTSTNYVNSSYFNNFVTPIQRRAQFPEYVMETCRKLPVSECTPNDWVVGYDINGDGDLDDTLDVDGNSVTEISVRGNQLGIIFNATISSGGADVNPLAGVTWDSQYHYLNNSANPQISPLERLGAGTTAQPALVETDRHFARRVAFARDELNELVPSVNTAQPLGVSCPLDTTGTTPINNGCQYPTTNSWSVGTHYGRVTDNTLWFRTTQNTTGQPNESSTINYRNDRPLYYEPPTNPDGQPLLVPILQLQYPTLSPTNTSSLESPTNQTKVNFTQWQQQPTQDTIFNLVLATGDAPTHPPYQFSDGLFHNGDSNGGLINLPRFAENWGAFTNNEKDVIISGSLIQLGRSTYATGPFYNLPYIISESLSTLNGGLFGYPQIYTMSGGSGRIPYYGPPGREWGFDLGLLSQIPDLFATQFSLKPTKEPNEFFREVSRDDDWIKTLLCATTKVDGNNAINDDQRPQNFCME